ncbi:DUF7010 family protein [Sphingomonas lenta]|uniref:DUF7010 family protein n=1 Tax=Sphingomonas lenta TaxID=1141887 RepID=UPI001140FAC2|nr:hypothetical protein [Sphingomonas lenta]
MASSTSSTRGSYAARPLSDLQTAIRSGDTRSMPLSGLILWTIGAVLGLFLSPTAFAYAVLWGTGLIVPLAILIARVRGHDFFAGRDNPLTQLFLQCILFVAALYPIAFIGAPGRPTLLVLYPAIAAGLIWIPWGWTADDPVGLRHAIGRTIACYAAYAFVPQPYTGSAICGAVVLAYIYSLAFMRRA